MTTDPSSAEFFEAKYRADSDPWRFASSGYELGRYEAILHALEGRRFRRAFEPGCSVGVLTEKLARLCDQVAAIEISATAAAAARERCSRLSNVTVQTGALPDALPDGEFDLIVFSEIGYYFSLETLSAIAHRLSARLAPSGILVAAHWLGRSADHVLTGDQVHEILEKTLPFRRTLAQRFEGFRLDRWERE